MQRRFFSLHNNFRPFGHRRIQQHYRPIMVNLLQIAQHHSWIPLWPSYRNGN